MSFWLIKVALEFDIGLLDKDSKIKAEKQERLLQIKEYIEAIQEIQKSKVLEDLSKPLPRYPEPLQKLMKADNANVHSMLLRPKALDESIRFVNPVFSVDRTSGGVFYQTLMGVFQHIKDNPWRKSKNRIRSTCL